MSTGAQLPKIWIPAVHGAAVSLSEFEIRACLQAIKKDVEYLRHITKFADEDLGRKHLADEHAVRLTVLLSAEMRLHRALQLAQIAAGLPDAARTLKGEPISEEHERVSRWRAIEACDIYYKRYGNLAPAERPSEELIEAVLTGVEKLEPKGSC